MQPDRLALVSVAAVLMLTCVGVGYGLDYTATTLNSNNTLDAKYMEFELNQSATCTFEFDDIMYYRDRAVSGDVHYKSNTAVSEVMTVKLVGTGVTGGTTAYVRLAEEVPGAELKIQFYTDDDTEYDTNYPCTNDYKYGGLITLSDKDQEISGGLDIDKVYWCVLTVTVVKDTLEETPSGSIRFNVVFHATAEATIV